MGFNEFLAAKRRQAGFNCLLLNDDEIVNVTGCESEKVLIAVKINLGQKDIDYIDAEGQLASILSVLFEELLKFLVKLVIFKYSLDLRGIVLINSFGVSLSFQDKFLVILFEELRVV